MIGVIVPVHNEQAQLGACLASIVEAAKHVDLRDEAVQIIVVLDACTDGSAAIAERSGARVLTLAAGNVGLARALGAATAIDQGASWLAFTDADTTVAPAWLAAQRALAADAVCGTVAVADWWLHSRAVQARYEQGYRDVDGHQHVHGANLGVSTAAYLRAGGFPPLPSGEDVALVEALQLSGARVAWSAAPRVFTSARVEACVVDGFGAFIRGIVAALAEGRDAASAPAALDHP